jgi:hypothetical protein
MPKVIKTAAELTLGDTIDFAGVEFELMKNSGPHGGFINLEFHIRPNTKRIDEMVIICRPTVPFTVITK